MNDAFEMMPLFSKPVYISKIDIAKKTKEDVKKLDFYNPVNSVGQISNDTYLLDNEPFLQLKEEIEKKIYDYVHNVLEFAGVEFYVTNSWVTVHDTDDFAPVHVHSNSIFSGTLYINIPKDDESVFQLHAPDTHKLCGLFQPNLKKYNIWNSAVSRIKPETGTIILFPSDLSHSTTPMTSKNEQRYCLAFNVFIKGELGYQENSLAGPLNRIVL